MTKAPPLSSPKGISQDNRLLRLDTVLGENVLLPQRVIAHERLGRGYGYTVDCLSLERAIELKKLIAQPITLWLRQTDRSYVPTHGYVFTSTLLGSDGQFTLCQLRFAPWLDFLKFRQDARIWQDKSADDILFDVFNGHPQASGKFRFSLGSAGRKPMPRSYCVQYESDWHFVHRLMEEEGWYYYHEQSVDGSGHTLVVTDNAQALPALTAQELCFHGGGRADEADKILQWSGTRTLTSNRLTTKTFNYKDPRYPQERSVKVFDEHGVDATAALEVYQYTGAYTHADDRQGDRQAEIQMEDWESQIKRFHGVAGMRDLPVGRFFSLQDHPAHRTGPVEEREFIIIAVEWFIENNLPYSKGEQDFPGSLKSKLNGFKRSMGLGLGLEDVAKHGGEGSGHCFNRFEAQRRKVPFRSPSEHAKPVMHAQTAIVVTHDDLEVFTDNLNRIKIKFHWDRLNPGNAMASCWVRVSYANGGDGFGSPEVPRAGQEVLVTFLGGNIDRPVVTGRLHNVHNLPPWHSDGALSGTKTKEINGAGFNQLVLDDNTGQNRAQLYSSNTNAQLNLGYLVEQEGNQRKAFYGAGFALCTDAYGAIVTYKGLYISTYGRPGAQGTQLDVREARQQLQFGLTLSKNMSDVAVKANAEALEATASLDAFVDATLDQYDGIGKEQANRFKEPVLLVASPAGIGLTTPKSNHLHSGENLTLSSGADTNIAAGKSLVASIAKKLSLSAHAGIKIFAAKGPIQIQAQGDDLDLIAEKVVRLLSTAGRIDISAKEEVLISVGGSFIRMDKAGITQGTAGAWIAHAATHAMPGPTTIAYHMNTREKTDFDEEFIARHRGSGKPVANCKFEIIREDGSVLHGITDAEGKTGIQKSQLMGNIHLKFLGAIPR
ncbi:MAG: type VI secretion system tip protein TssI/VgrG [Pseudomonadota bacterium]